MVAPTNSEPDGAELTEDEWSIYKKRITITAVWLKFPKISLMDLISRAVPSDKDPYTLSDDDLLEYLEAYAARAGDK